MVNRIWLHLFGQAIVETPDDFGVYGSRPIDPLLMDHLAQRFVDNGWSIKQMVRVIVLSRTFQLSSQVDADAIEADPNNRLFARHQRRRLDAESLRDSMLIASGQADLSPGQGSAVEQTDILINWPLGESTNLHRPSSHRSIYLCMLRHAPPVELSAFNLPDGTSVVGQRDQTTLPTQALFLMNSPFVREQAERLASAVMSIPDADDSQRVTEVFRRTLGREPSATDLRESIVYMASVSSNNLNPLRVWASLCQALLSTNEFRYVD